MKLYDFYFVVDKKQEIRQVEWGSEEARTLYQELFSGWIARGFKTSDVFTLGDSVSAGELVWDEERFDFEKLEVPEGGYYLLMKKHDDRDYLFAKALDYVAEGVQIYDKNASAVFLNRASRALSHIPPDVTVRGRHLLDMYVLDENVSTIMTCLRTQSPVINRVDHYQSKDGIAIASANTAYPIHRGGELVGSVVFEQSSETVRTYEKKMQEIDWALKHFEEHTAHYPRFVGYTFENIIGHGKKLREAVEIARKVAAQNSSILLVGETGTGKEIFAQSIHRASSRREKRFVALNCAAIPESLIESLLFGTQKGSFTGSENKPGYFEEAEGGTLFLDELNSMSLAMQSKILRAIQENTFRRVGGQKDIRMDVRFISSCNEDPFHSIAENHFRKDLFYRLSTVMIELPPLREHTEDLEELIRYHLDATSYQYVHPFSEISPDVMELFRAYGWPGNVRELYHVLDYAQNVSDGERLEIHHLPGYLRKAWTEQEIRRQEAEAAEGERRMKRGLRADRALGRAEDEGGEDAVSGFVPGEELQGMMDAYEEQLLRAALDYYGYNITRAAEALGLRRQSLQYRIKKFGIQI